MDVQRELEISEFCNRLKKIDRRKILIELNCSTNIRTMKGLRRNRRCLKNKSWYHHLSISSG